MEVARVEHVLVVIESEGAGRGPDARAQSVGDLLVEGRLLQVELINLKGILDSRSSNLIAIRTVSSSMCLICDEGVVEAESKNFSSNAVQKQPARTASIVCPVDPVRAK